MRKREFLKGAVGVVAVSALPAASFVHSSPRPSTVAFAVYDRRYADARLFASTLAEGGALTYDASEDVAALWYGRLRSGVGDLQPKGRALAGMTTAADLSILQDFARDLRLKLRYRGIHDHRSYGHAEHRLSCCSDEWREMAAGMTRAGSKWPCALAVALNASHTSKLRPAVDMPVRTARSQDHAGVLVSWLLA